MRSLFIFLKNPVPPNNTPENNGIKSNIVIVLKLLLLTIGLSIAVGFLCTILDNLVVAIFSTSSIIKIRDENFHSKFDIWGKYKILYIVIIGPLLEELIFRLPLEPKEAFIAFPVGFLLYNFCGYSLMHFNFYTSYSYLTAATFIFLFPLFLIFIFKKINIRGIIIRYYKFYFYAIASLFALLHTYCKFKAT